MATPGLVFRIGGVLDPSLKGALGESVAAARSAAATANRGGAMMARDLKGEIAALKKSLISDNFADSVLVNAPILMRDKVPRRSNYSHCESGFVAAYWNCQSGSGGDCCCCRG